MVDLDSCHLMLLQLTQSAFNIGQTLSCCRTPSQLKHYYDLHMDTYRNLHLFLYSLVGLFCFYLASSGPTLKKKNPIHLLFHQSVIYCWCEILFLFLVPQHPPPLELIRQERAKFEYSACLDCCFASNFYHDIIVINDACNQALNNARICSLQS